MIVEFEKRDHIAIITLNRPEARNAVNGEVAIGIEAAMDQFESDDSLWVGILTAVGKVFCAGADLKEISAGKGATLSTKKGGFGGLANRERSKPLIAAVSGAAVAGGCELTLACDMIIASEAAVFGLPEVKRSLVAAGGGLFRLPRALGMQTAMEVILTGDPISSQRAYELGMVNKVVPTDQVMAAALALAGRVIANAPLAVQASRGVAAKALIDNDAGLWHASGAAMGTLVKTEDFKEGLLAFIEKRMPDWKAR